MMNEPASLFVVVFTALNIVACLWLMWWTARTRSGHGSAESGTQAQPAAADQTAGAHSSGKTGHVWDGDLEEYNNPLPRWWLGLFILTVLFAIAYLTFYPGLGNFTGAGGWSSPGAYEKEMARLRQRFETRLASVRDKSLHDLARDPAAMSTARNLFGANCSTCHGSDARGAKGFPNLADGDWLWGGDETTVYQSIAQGRQGVMPALGAALGPNGVNEVASYIVSLDGRKAPQDWVAAGKDRFATLCAACHGLDAKGNAQLGAPNLTDEIWLHGGDFDSVRATIDKGRDSRMPAHADLLGDTKVRLLAAYVLSLSGAATTMEREDPSRVDAAAANRESRAQLSRNETVQHHTSAQGHAGSP
jgi:cytochrome c oxidase cbb3-type subunit 3